MRRGSILVLAVAVVVWVQGGAMAGSGDDLYAAPTGVQTRWVSFENPTGAVGAGGKENKGAKGQKRPFEVPGKRRIKAEI